jgi:hypothetical protein
MACAEKVQTAWHEKRRDDSPGSLSETRRLERALRPGQSVKLRLLMGSVIASIKDGHSIKRN